MQDTATSKQSENGSELTGKQSKALCLLVAGNSIEKAAESASVNAATVHRWLKEPRFKEEYREARRVVVGQATATLQAATRGAVATLVSVAADKDAPPSSRIAAAKTILELALKSVEIDDLAARIDALEQLQ